jgi:hypothetical protein
MRFLGGLWNLLILLGDCGVTDFLEEGLSPWQVGNLPHVGVLILVANSGYERVY